MPYVSRLWQRKDKFRTDTYCTDDIDRLLVGVYDLPANGKSKPRSQFIPAPGEVRFVKTIPDLSHILLWDPDTGIFH